jgi:CubicO group peptidase (beta-lactamase class C family)
MKNIVKMVLYCVLGLVILGGISLGYFSIRYSPEYILRECFTNTGTVYDYNIFPGRPLTASPEPYYFISQPDEARIQALFQTNPKVDNLENFLTGTGTQAFIVIQNDVILYENYFNDSQRDSLVTSMSVAKSFDSALIGIAISEGYLNSVDDPITDYLPELAARDPRFQNITIRHLLTMQSGLRYDENRPFSSNDGSLTYGFPDLRHLALTETKIVEQPGEHWLYNNYNPLLLGMILERVTGKTVTEYLQEKIWSRVGMEFGGSWSMDSEASGFEKMESGINARAIDFAKFGRLFLNNGIWNGVQVIPSEWVKESTGKEQSISLGGDEYYKYMWWGIIHDQGYDYFAAGNMGQIIYISPANNLIIVRHGEKYGLKEEGAAWLDILSQFANAIPAINQ